MNENRLHTFITQQEAEIKNKINLILEGLESDFKIKMLADLIDGYEAADKKYYYLEMGPIWEEQVAQQNQIIKKLERRIMLLKITTAFLLIYLICI